MSAPFVSNSFSTPSPVIPTHTIAPLQNAQPSSNDTLNQSFPLVTTQIAPIPVAMQFSDTTPDVKAQVSSPDLKYGYLYEEIIKQQIFLPNENVMNTETGEFLEQDSQSEYDFLNLVICILMLCILCMLCSLA